MLEKARSLSPFDGYIVDSVGWAYYRLGRYDDAAKTLESCHSAGAGRSRPSTSIWAMRTGRLGRKLDARFQWSHALAFGPDKTQKAEIEKKLQSGDEREVSGGLVVAAPAKINLFLHVGASAPTAITSWKASSCSRHAAMRSRLDATTTDFRCR